MDRFGRITVQIRNLNLEVELHFMLVALRPVSLRTVYAKNPGNISSIPTNSDSLNQLLN